MQRIDMNTLKEVLRLKYISGLSNRQIQTLTGVSKSSISNYCKSFERSEIEIAELLVLEDSILEEKLYGTATITSVIDTVISEDTTLTHKPHPDWNYVHNELKKKGITRMLLWEEYKQAYPNGYGYSQFKKYYARYAKRLNPSMRQIHYAGDKLFVDFSGLTMEVVDQKTGEIKKIQIFVSVLGASGYTYVHAVESQSTSDFIECNVQALHFYGGVPNTIVPDNLKAAVISNNKNGIRLNESYAHMGKHYGVAIVPARPYKPQDKSKVELGVKGIQRWILMKLRNHTFFSVDEINDALSPLLDQYNNKVIRKLGKSRTELFNEIDKTVLHPLRANRYIYTQFKIATVGVDYHVELDSNGYSVPYQYIGKKVEVAYTRSSVAISYQGKTIALHPKIHRAYEDSTNKDHMPPSHAYQFEKWNPGRILNWASDIGNNTTALVKKIMENKTHMVRGYKSCMAILSLSKTYGNIPLELACKTALSHNTTKVSSIESILKLKTYEQDHLQQPVNNLFNPTTSMALFNTHENIRGKEYYQ